MTDSEQMSFRLEREAHENRIEAYIQKCSAAAQARTRAIGLPPGLERDLANQEADEALRAAEHLRESFSDQPPAKGVIDLSPVTTVTLGPRGGSR